jgi:outer membrane lipoprotein SlyB
MNGGMMKLHRIAAVATLGTLLSLPLSLTAQEYALLQHVSQSAHDRAEQEQTEKDHRNHTGAKIVGGSAAGGAVVGALAGGGKGALIGGAVGAGGGAIANKVRKDKAVKDREQRESEYHHSNHDHDHDYPR